MIRTKKALAFCLAAVAVITAAILFYFVIAYSAHKKYDADIKKWAAFYEQEPELVYAVIKTESGFNRAAVSRVGAMGLMQIMPETAIWIAQKLGKEDFQPEMLFDAALNIEFGVWYLAYLSQKFDSTKEVLIAYNAGEGNARRWRDAGIEPPFKETKNYIKKVARHYRFFKIYL